MLDPYPVSDVIDCIVRQGHWSSRDGFWLMEDGLGRCVGRPLYCVFCENCGAYFCLHMEQFTHRGPPKYRRRALCRKCDAAVPNGASLWDKLRRWHKVPSLLHYWVERVHHPAYVATHAAIAAADLAGVFGEDQN